MELDRDFDDACDLAVRFVCAGVGRLEGGDLPVRFTGVTAVSQGFRRLEIGHEKRPSRKNRESLLGLPTRV